MRIKFSHNYPKFWNQTEAELLAMKIIDAEDVQKNEDLLKYDTCWYEDGQHGQYELPEKGKLIQLIFLGNKNIPFCTLRRYTEQKHRYYLAQIEKIFKVVVN